MQTRRVRRPGPSPSRRNTAKPTAQVAEVLYEYEDGGVYTPDGDELVAPIVDSTADAASLSASATTTSPPTNTPQVNVATRADPTATAAPANAAPQASATTAPQASASASTATDASPTDDDKIDAIIERQFLSSFSAESHGQSDPYVRTERNSRPRLSTAVACTAALVFGTAALAFRSTRLRALITLLAVATPAGALNTCAQHTHVHSSDFSRSQAKTLHAQSMLNGTAPRFHGIVDSGTTECTSGRRKLFPDSHIEQRDPPIHVEIASGLTLPVAIKGGMLLKIRKYGTTSTKKTFTTVCPNSLYVPKMPVTLVSTKALFRELGIRTYFNDELVFVTSSGERIGFVETPVNYTVLFDDDPTTIIAVSREPIQPDAHFTATLREPLPMTWDLCHGRFCHFSPTRMQASLPYLVNAGFDNLGPKPRSDVPCIHCIRGSFRGHRKGKRVRGQHTRFGQCVFSDSCRMPKSTPFGFIYMYIFYDAFTKFIAIYFGKTVTADEMMRVHKQFVTDYGRYMRYGRVELWYADGGPEFSSDNTTIFCNEMSTRLRFIAPWNPWMNVAETGWRIILRPLRIILAACNASRRLWPFAVSQIVTVHNALSTSSESAPEGLVAQAFFAAMSTSTASPSPYFLVTGKKYDASRLRTMFCEVEIRIRNQDDLRKREKHEAITDTAMHLGIDSRSVGYLVYIFGRNRFTTASFNDVYFRENKLPRLDRIVGSFSFDNREGMLPTQEQQDLDDGNLQFPELDDVRQQHDQPPAATADVPAPTTTQPAHRPNVDEGWAHRDATATHFSPKQCADSRCQIPCTNGKHDDGDKRHSYQRTGDHINGNPAARTRARTHRNEANIINSIENDTTGILQPSGHHACPVILVGDDPSNLTCIAYNLEITSYGDVQLPSSTPAALNGPQGKEWREAYARDLTAKIKNATFSYVPRPIGEKVIRTKVAHALKRDELTNAVVELRGRWVGMGFLQGIHDFLDTYTATPTATSLRVFLNMVLVLNLTLAQGDVTKAFTLNPIDVRLHVEQMPGMEVAGDWPGATKENTVCLLHKCLEGLKQAGNIWQTTHTAAILAFRLTAATYRFEQSTTEPCLFILHCSKGIIAILVWIDDILVAYNGRELYDAFLKVYKERFPSKHHDGCVKFAGVSIDYKPGVSLRIDQRTHIEMAYEKFIVDKKAAARSPAVSRIAVSDRDSSKHYSKITLASNDTERSTMKSKPFLPALATVMYITYWTLAHLAYHCSYLGQFMHDPSPLALEAVYDMIIYAYHNRDIDIIIYTRDQYSMPRSIPDSARKQFEANFGLHGYSDASWMLRSVAGYIVLMCNGPVDWGSKGIRVICHSSAEAEIAGGCALGKRAIFIIMFVGEFYIKLGKFPLLIDNTAAMDLSNKLGVQSRTAHFLRWQHYLRWLVLHQYVELYFVGTKEQLADMLTKILDISTFLFFCKQIYGLRRKTMKA